MEEIKAVKPFKPLQRKVKDVSLIKELRKHAPNASKEYISHYLFQEGNGGVRVHFNDVCYARFKCRDGRGYIPADTGIIKARVYMNQWPNHFTTPKDIALYKKYVDWVINKSPWKDAFLNGKSDYFKDGLAINCNQVHQYVFGAMTAIREPLEHHYQIHTWETLIEKGISPEFAHVLSGLTMDGGVIGGRGGGHDLFDREFGLNALKAYKVMDHKYKNKKPLKETAKDMYGIQQMFSLAGDSLHTILKPLAVAVKADWYTLHKLDWNNPAVIDKLKEIDNA